MVLSVLRWDARCPGVSKVEGIKAATQPLAFFRFPERGGINGEESMWLCNPDLPGVPRVDTWPISSPILGGRLKRSARAVQLFGRLAVLETHIFRY